ncbi:hypothetical protein [Streptomyces prunicolor]|uniref:hypothetical protein n=1 Tax=Streptomyces prunicolor TaxID=67348 RepID=UPI00341BEFBA
MQRDNRSLAHALSGTDVEWLTGLSTRTVAAFQPRLERGREAGLVHRDVGVQDLMPAYPQPPEQWRTTTSSTASS